MQFLYSKSGSKLKRLPSLLYLPVYYTDCVSEELQRRCFRLHSRGFRLLICISCTVIFINRLRKFGITITLNWLESSSQLQYIYHHTPMQIQWNICSNNLLEQIFYYSIFFGNNYKMAPITLKHRRLEFRDATSEKENFSIFHLALAPIKPTA